MATGATPAPPVALTGESPAALAAGSEDAPPTSPERAVAEANEAKLPLSSPAGSAVPSAAASAVPSTTVPSTVASGRGKKRQVEEADGNPQATTAGKPPEAPVQQKRQKATASATAAVQKEAKEQIQRYQASLANTLSKKAQAERRELRERLRRDSRKLGTFSRGIYGHGTDPDSSLQWDGGTDQEEIDALRKRIQEQKLQIEKLEQSVKSRQKSIGKKGGEQTQTAEELEDDLWEQRELCFSKAAALRRSEIELKDSENTLHIARKEHARVFRAIEAEDQMNFGSFSPLVKRYQRLRLLSRGRSTEVYEAFDVITLQPCLVKIHHLHLDTNEKASCLEGISKECDAIKSLKHGSAFGALLNNFELEGGSKYVMVWEYWEGEVYDTFCDKNSPVSEKDARGMLLQLLGALRTAEKAGIGLSTLELKTSRLNFRGGELKITSLGLPSLRSATNASSSLVRARSISLDVPGDSPGLDVQDDAGLCNDAGPALRLGGAILYELLLGKPLGQQLVGADAAPLEWPDSPKLTQDVRDCICRMLDEESRLTLQEVYSDPFITGKRKAT